MKIVTSNIKSVPPMLQSRVKSDIDQVSSLGSAILWQEIQPDRYKDAVHGFLDKARWHNINMKVETPISLNKHVWEVVASGVIRTHKGRKLVSPDRYISWVIARVRGTKKVIVFINTHFVSGAFSNNHIFTKKWRRKRWDYHFKMMDTVVERFVAAGYTVIGGGDWNRTDPAKFKSNQRWLSRGGIDHLFTVENTKGIKVRLKEIDYVPGLHTDHAPRVAELSLDVGPKWIAPTKIPKFTDLKALAK